MFQKLAVGLWDPAHARQPVEKSLGSRLDEQRGNYEYPKRCTPQLWSSNKQRSFGFNVKQLFDSNSFTESTPAFLMLQNVGTVPVFYRLSENAASSDYYCTTADTKYSGILAAGDADKDGTGGVMTFAGYTGGLAFTVASGSTGKVNISYSGRLGD